MASIRARLTMWNGAVLVLVLCVFALAAYAFLRYVTLAQIDRALHQQMRVVALTARANLPAPDGDVFGSLVQDLEVHGLLVARPASLPGALVTAPVRVEEDDERREPPKARRPAWPDIDWIDLRHKLVAEGDGEGAFSVRGRRGGVRALAERVQVGTHRLTLVVTQPLHETVELLETARVAALVALPIALMLALVSGYALARRALDPISAMTQQAQQIGAHTLHERLSVQNPRDELGQLALTFNDVLERIESALAQQRRFTADASHELRTPIALIRAEADVALADSMSSERDYQQALTVIRDGSHQLTRIVNDLFLLARADAGQSLVDAKPMYLDELVTTTAYSMRSLAEQRNVLLGAQVNGDAPYHGDEDLLRRALRNLLDNAIKYSRGNGQVDVSLTQESGAYRLRVTDNGAGILVEDQHHIFERFYRGDATRAHSESANGSGAGLGLAIAREIAEWHGGRLDLHRSSPSGSVFDLVLPLAV